MEESKAKHTTLVLWITRVAFAAVFVLNAMCAIQFIADPAAFTGAYQLQGEGAQAAIQGYGVAFLMWNATYPLFIYKPDKYKALGAIILVQQAIGCIGESLILAALPQTATMLASSITRFIAFDAAGLFLMLIAYTVFRLRSNRG